MKSALLSIPGFMNVTVFRHAENGIVTSSPANAEQLRRSIILNAGAVPPPPVLQAGVTVFEIEMHTPARLSSALLPVSVGSTPCAPFACATAGCTTNSNEFVRISDMPAPNASSSWITSVYIPKRGARLVERTNNVFQPLAGPHYILSSVLFSS
jgi:hypothetical protein